MLTVSICGSISNHSCSQLPISLIQIYVDVTEAVEVSVNGQNLKHTSGPVWDIKELVNNLICSSSNHGKNCGSTCRTQRAHESDW